MEEIGQLAVSLCTVTNISYETNVTRDLKECTITDACEVEIMAKQAPLVTQYLERISRDAVEKHQKLFRDYVRHRQGV
jgi:hypothetical protein